MSIGVLINHAISFLTSPLAVSIALIVFGVCLSATMRSVHRTRIGRCFALVGIVYLLFMSSGLAYWWLGLGLEREFPPQRVEDLPSSDAIVVLGGGVGGNTNANYYAELFPAADRAAHAARIWKAGKAPVVIASGCGELQATLPFLKELGVPEKAILVENKSGNTEENARFVREVVLGRPLSDDDRSKRKILLVTSAWHMRRALLMFRKYVPDIEVVPAACDYEATLLSVDFDFWKALLPNADSLQRNSYMLKEYIGYWGYRLLR